jgi:hydrogenase/urease accessory protein HupE
VGSHLFQWFWVGVVLLCGRLHAHPFLNNTWQVLVEDRRLVMRATATLREVSVVQGMPTGGWTNLPVLMQAVSNHAAYVTEHLRVDLNGARLPMECLDFQLLLEDSIEPEDSDKYPDLTHVAYDLECVFPEGTKVSTAEAAFSHRTLEGRDYSPGIAWDPFYVLLVADGERRSLGQAVVRRGSPEKVRLALAVPTGTATSTPVGGRSGGIPAGSMPALSAMETFGSFLRHGLHHVVTGYDHLLFLVALSLAAGSWGRLMAIIGIFTLAHSITVTLAALGWVSLPAWFVEPVIAGSIVFVGLQNILSPAHARGRFRLAVAFGFGLIHGMGFAGGLREVISEGPTGSLAVTVLAFCLGVELGHLAVGAPLFGILRAFRTQAGATREEGERAGSDGTMAPVGGVVRWGSLAVSIGGAWYLWLALRAI